MFFIVGDFAFVTDIRPCQCIITSNHYAPNVCFFQFWNSIFSLWFEFILKNFKPIKSQFRLGIMSLDCFHSIWIYFLTAKSKNPKSSWSKFFKGFFEICWCGRTGDKSLHNLWRSLNQNLTALAWTVLANHTHSL